MASLRVDAVEGRDALAELIAFHDEVYRTRSARWAAFPPLQLPFLLGEGPFAEERLVRSFAARDGGRLVARGVAVVDERYRRHWQEPLGHLVLFEALPDTGDAVRALVDEAAEWLAESGSTAMRAGMGVLDYPFSIDDYETLPPAWARQSPAYYHALLKDAGFETEQGFVDYKLRVTPALVAEWEQALAAAEASGYRIVPLAEVTDPARDAMFIELWNAAFARHWGYSPFTVGEFTAVRGFFAALGMLDVSMLAFRRDEPVGALWVVPSTAEYATRAPGRELRDDERLNVLGIAIRDVARGRGVNLAMAARSFLELVRRGATWLSYTLVLDDNWPSRRTAEKLGARVCANYVAYRRRIGRLTP
jgi:hypothetical protein